ncbi:hypothetical protein Syun_026079 [Stephania yunnanensis]|uniref:Uncharacterized protein n=1 Tax=Stephania yunnanensis TaxID=152371 RepID=A0AAP0ETB1_9MAGN
MASDQCSLCRTDGETVIHTLKDNSYAREVQTRNLKPNIDASFYDRPLEEWMAFNVSHRDPKWRLVFGVTCWSIWFCRNEHAFNSSTTTSVELSNEAQFRTREIIRNLSVLKQSKLGKLLRDDGRWKPPEEGWTKLNCDGAVSRESSVVGAASLFRDSKGKFFRRLSISSRILLTNLDRTLGGEGWPSGSQVYGD